MGSFQVSLPPCKLTAGTSQCVALLLLTPSLPLTSACWPPFSVYGLGKVYVSLLTFPLQGFKSREVGFLMVGALRVSDRIWLWCCLNQFDSFRVSYGQAFVCVCVCVR